jgi:plastocyanin
MRAVRFFLACSILLRISLPLVAGPDSGTLAGIVTLKGPVPKPKPLDLSKDPACAQLHPNDTLMDESVVAGRGNGLANVVVYISAGDSNKAPAPANIVPFKQLGCRYKTHVLAVRVGQEINIINSDPVSHNIHPLATLNREWSRIQPHGTPPFSYSYEKEEFIPVKCNIHPWMHGYIVVLKTSHFAVTSEDGVFHLPNLPPGKYTITAWHELLGTQTQEITITAGQTTSVYLAFSSPS